ncbi:MAG: hypothetical protein Q4F34_07610, partial [Prevotellaceae bacterium]|nr:hypothetical protein [Prevotellaceae bacterium]
MKKILLAIVTLLATMNTNAQIIKVFANDDTFPIDYFINDANHKYKFVFQETSAVDQVFKCVKVNGHYVYVTLEDDAVGDVSISTQINGETVSVSAQSQSGKYLKLTADNCAKSGKVISGETTAYEWELSNITDNVSAVVEYTDKQSFTITIAENLEHGSIKSTTPSGICAWGETVMVKLAPDEGYFVESIKYNDGTDHDITDTGSFTMPQANVTITATFEEIPIYTEGSFSAPGIKIGGVWWAPVNCGYDATYHPYGSLYQWGRKYGQACELGKDISFGLMQKTDDTEANKDKFGYFNSGFFYNWYEAAINAFDNTMWNGTTKGENDPSPDGW